jgi:hypothetical protein
MPTAKVDESRENGGGLRRGCGFASGLAAGGNWTPDGILQLEGEANFSCAPSVNATVPLAPEVIGTPPTCWQFSDSLPIPSGPASFWRRHRACNRIQFEDNANPRRFSDGE